MSEVLTIPSLANEYEFQNTSTSRHNLFETINLKIKATLMTMIDFSNGSQDDHLNSLDALNASSLQKIDSL